MDGRQLTAACRIPPQHVEGGQVDTIDPNTDGSEDLGVMEVNTRWIAPIAHYAHSHAALGSWATPNAVRLASQPVRSTPATGYNLLVGTSGALRLHIAPPSHAYARVMGY